jgi:Coenzyme PQQ synthesis protein D (PqqD)
VNETYTDGSIVRRTTDQVSSNLAGEAIVLDIKSGRYFGMQEVGALIWSMLEKPRTVGEIREAIMSEYEVDQETCEHELTSFLHQMESAALIEIENGAGA